MNPTLFIVVPTTAFTAIDAVDGLLGTNLIHNAVAMGGNTYYITSNLTPPGGTLYIARLNANGSFLVSQSRQPAFLTVVHTFFGWAVPS